MKRTGLGLLLGVLAATGAPAGAVELKSVTIVPGLIATNIYTGLVAFGANPDRRFEGCVQRPTRLLFGTSQQVGINWPSSEVGRRDVLATLLEAKRTESSVTVTYYAAPNGLCYFRGVSY